MIDFRKLADNLMFTANYLHDSAKVPYPPKYQTASALYNALCALEHSDEVSDRWRHRVAISYIAPMLRAARSVDGFERADIAPNGTYRERSMGAREVADTSEPSQGLSEALEERRRKNTPASVPNGSVVRFQRQLSSHRSPYSYAAIWVSEVGKWYLSGSGGTYSHTDFLDLLAEEDTMHVQYAADWKDL